MNIGILTLPLWNNYGGIIQAYALQEVIKELGHSCNLIDYHHNSSKMDQNLFLLKRFIKYKFLKKSDSAYYPSLSENLYISQKTLRFIDENFPKRSLKLYTENDLKKYSNSLDGVIVGSDQ